MENDGGKGSSAPAKRGKRGFPSLRMRRALAPLRDRAVDGERGATPTKVCEREKHPFPAHTRIASL